MSLFIASLSFYGTEHLAAAKTAILLASLLAGFAGWLVLRVSSPVVPAT
jgi:Na+/H+ antiporter NhaA